MNFPKGLTYQERLGYQHVCSKPLSKRNQELREAFHELARTRRESASRDTQKV